MKDADGNKMVKIPKAYRDYLRHPIDHPECYKQRLAQEVINNVEEELELGWTYPEVLAMWKKEVKIIKS